MYCVPLVSYQLEDEQLSRFMPNLKLLRVAHRSFASGALLGIINLGGLCWLCKYAGTDELVFEKIT